MTRFQRFSYSRFAQGLFFGIVLTVAVLWCMTEKVHASTGSPPVVWQTTDTVTASKLNQNENAPWAVINGNLDNTNMTSGYLLYRQYTSLPVYGSQGAIAYSNVDSSIYWDTGTAWKYPIAAPSGAATGQLIYYNAGWAGLTPGAQYTTLQSNGVSSLPSYGAVNLAQ